MSGHVFVVGGDLTRLACDDVVVPTDGQGRVGGDWLPLLPGDRVAGGDDVGARVLVDGAGAGRVVAVPGDAAPRVWLVDTVSDEGRGLPWLLEGARAALAAVAERPVTRPRHGRARRLVGLPALGTGWGAAAGDRGALLEALLPVLTDAARESGLDVALVLRSPSDLAAAQHVRRSGAGAWDLPEDLHAAARSLAGSARLGGLAVFAGAGVSAAAGMPTWGQLLDELAARSGLGPELRAGLTDLAPQDSAALLARELGRDRLAAYVQERFAAPAHALSHALLAGLPVQEMVTTNYDALLELAAAGSGRPLRVLPFEEPEPGQPWLLKLHGDIGRPDTVVLTREHYLHTGDHRAALAGVMHALLLTRHVLFVGASMLDDDLIRIAHDVRSALRSPAAPRRRTGTVLALTDEPARARLWAEDVETVPLAPAGTATPEAARRLEVFLDLLGCLACPPTGYLLDPAYRGMLDDDEAALADALRALPAAARAAHDEGTGADVGRGTGAWQEVEALLRRLGG